MSPDDNKYASRVQTIKIWKCFERETDRIGDNCFVPVAAAFVVVRIYLNWSATELK